MNDDLISRKQLVAHLQRRIKTAKTYLDNTAYSPSHPFYNDQMDFLYDVIVLIEDYEPADEADL